MEVLCMCHVVTFRACAVSQRFIDGIRASKDAAVNGRVRSARRRRWVGLSPGFPVRVCGLWKPLRVNALVSVQHGDGTPNPAKIRWWLIARSARLMVTTPPPDMRRPGGTPQFEHPPPRAQSRARSH